VLTSLLIFEGRTNLGYSWLWNRVAGVLTLPGARFANAVFSSGVPNWIWENFWSVLAIACNLMVYAFFWCGFIWVASYFRERGHPYDRQSPLVPPNLGTHSAVKEEPGPFDLRYYQ
jgi:hypothetical protein